MLQGIGVLAFVRSRLGLVSLAISCLMLVAWLRPVAVVDWHVPDHLRDALLQSPGSLGPTPTVVIHARERPFVADPTQNDTVPWTSTSFLESSEPHRIVSLPRRPALDPTAPSEADLLFAFTTSYSRATSYAALWTHFLDAQSHCFVLLPPEDAEHATELETYLRQTAGVPCAVRVSKIQGYEFRVGSVVSEAVTHAADSGEPFKWLIVGDDDTFWLDMRTVRRMLGRYDARKHWFIGGLTEAVAQWGAFGRQAYGGAGIIISQPLVVQMATRFADCLKAVEGVWTGGDGVLTYCAALIEGVDHADVLTESLGMHQMDVPGDGTGFFQSGLPFVSVHHYIDGWVDFVPKSWPDSHSDDRTAIGIIGQSVKAIGGDNLFRRYVFDGGRVLFTSGYSISVFKQPLTPDDLTKMEYTWNDGYNMRFPQRDNVPEGDGKTTYYILGVENAGADEQARPQFRFTFAARDGRRIDVLWTDI